MTHPFRLPPNPEAAGNGEESLPVSSTSWPRRLIGPSGLAFVLLCFLMPFFTVSCSGAMGDLALVYSGYDLAFGGLPTADGSLAAELAEGDLEDARSGVQVMALLALLVVVAGGVAGAVLPTPTWRWAAVAAAAGLAVISLSVNQTMVYGSAREEIEGSSEVPYAAVDATTGAGFWFAVLVLVAVTVHAVVELFLERSRANRSAVPGGAGGPGGPWGPGPQGPPGQGQGPPGWAPPPGGQAQYPRPAPGQPYAQQPQRQQYPQRSGEQPQHPLLHPGHGQPPQPQPPQGQPPQESWGQRPPWGPPPDSGQPPREPRGQGSQQQPPPGPSEGQPPRESWGQGSQQQPPPGPPEGQPPQERQDQRSQGHRGQRSQQPPPGPPEGQPPLGPQGQRARPHPPQDQQPSRDPGQPPAPQ
jgi:hypothetical protein